MVEGRVTVKSVSLFWSVMSALLLKIAQEKTTGGGVTGVKQGMLDESQGPGGSYSERCPEVGVTLEMGVFGHVVCDVKAAAKNNPGEIHRVVWVRRGKLDSTANGEA